MEPDRLRGCASKWRLVSLSRGKHNDWAYGRPSPKTCPRLWAAVRRLSLPISYVGLYLRARCGGNDVIALRLGRCDAVPPHSVTRAASFPHALKKSLSLKAFDK